MRSPSTDLIYFSSTRSTLASIARITYLMTEWS
jgi:hypothetical protein